MRDNIDLKYKELLKEKFSITIKENENNDNIHVPNGLKRLTSMEDFYKLDLWVKNVIINFLKTNDTESLKIDNNKITNNDLLAYFNIICDIKHKNVARANYKKNLLAEMVLAGTDNLRISDYTTIVPISNEVIEKINEQIINQEEALEKNVKVFSQLNDKIKETETLNEALKTKIATESSVEKINEQINDYSKQRLLFGKLIIIAVIIAIFISAFLLSQDKLVQNVFGDFKTSLVFVSILFTMYSILLNFLIKNYNNAMSMLENKKEKLHNLELFMSLSSSDVELGSDLESIRKKLLTEILTVKGNNWDRVDSSNLINTVLSKGNSGK